MKASKRPNLKQQTTSGFLWMLLQTVGNQAFHAISMIVLAWLLTPGDMGLVAIASAFLVLSSVIEEAGTRDVLIQRQRHFRRWANSLFWFSVYLSLGAALLIAGLAPLAAMVTGERDLLWLTLIAATVPIVRAPSIIPYAALSCQMRFRTMARVQFEQVAFIAAGSIALAAMGWGPYSMLVPVPVAALLRTAYLWRVCGVRIRLSPQARRWRYIVGDSLRIVTANMAAWVIRNADYLVLGALATIDETGYYFFAFGFSSQPLRLFSNNLRAVLLPALSKLQHNPKRLLEAYLRAMRLIATAGIPACISLVAVADPLLRAMFDDRWVPAIPVLQILGIVAVFRLFTGTTSSLNRSTGRFGADMRMLWCLAGAFVTGVTIGALLGGAVAVALGVLAVFALFIPVYAYLAARPLGGRFVDLIVIIAKPMLLSLFAGGLAYVVADRVPAWPLREWIRLLVALMVFVPVYGLGVWFVCRPEVREMRALLTELVSRRMRRQQRDATHDDEASEDREAP